LRLPSDSTSPWTPLPSASGSHYQAHSGLSPPSYRPCRAHIKKHLMDAFFQRGMNILYLSRNIQKEE
ncbi:MAG: hypothetical protein WBK73_00425, partial [Tepidanaerobacteraceae bacterium]